ncbi:hypothetical protein [Paenibacillus sp. LHD-38]|uniref:hypothetical protein n=1 Tax=Paenibacillus sp. LHD-38 TaxID=3072143 RepID=UPI00280C93C3|nr:hypothetical protein [Paenibacillus sp. LHD-38]MDQ8737475.1 hypothetical protein [Paenibacillus sp. LHD-38]
MNHLQLPIPEYRRKGFSLLKHAVTLFFKNGLPLLFIVAIMAVPVEAIKNYYFFEPSDSEIFFPSSRMDNLVYLLFLSAITPMVIHFILGRMNASTAGLKASLLWGLRKWPRMIVYSFLNGAIVAAGIVMFVVPGLLFAVWLMLLPVIVSVMDTSRINPLTVCRELARRRYFKFVLYAVGGYAAFAVLFFILIALFSFMSSDSWITATLFDLCFDWLIQLISIVMLLVFLQVKTEVNEQAPDSINQAE